MRTSITTHAKLSADELSSVMGMAWSLDTPFEAIAMQFGLSEAQVIALMRDQLKTRSFRLWRKRMRGRSAKHENRQQIERLIQTHASSASVQSVALGTLDEAGYPEFISPVSQASLR